MPVENHHTVKAGTASKILLLFAHAANDRAFGMSGLTHDMPGAVAAYVREGESAAHRVALVPGRLGKWIAGSLAEVDATLMPGAYQFGVPDLLLAQGSTRALLMLRFPGAWIPPVEFSLVAYDPQDGERIGVSGLSNDKRHEFLRRAMPRLTEMELSLGEKAERELRFKLTGAGDP